ncbi:aminopeptidase N [Corynebacterium testudinoris]|uniref:aminopeptidase N n=1 Tax=Corynebacterium testudinoris TaxID=136857 RepID=UPI001C8CDBFD|nr:aminopeptidase N [Corynebacterium testudinoris]MBX8996676.1 aminopeptidase N [Corynebacterium testudinoris]
MTSTNLTREEAAHRARLLTVDNYDIALDLTQSDTEFSSLTTVEFTVREPGSTFIDLRAKRVDGVYLDGKNIRSEALTLDKNGYDESFGIALNDLTVGRHVLRVNAQCLYSRTGEGLHRFVDPADSQVYLYTQFETADAKRVFACFDQPDLKATYDLTVCTPSAWKVISNAPQRTTMQEDSAIHTSRIDYPLSTYLVAICAGRYHEVRSTWKGQLTHHAETPASEPTELEVPMSIFCRRSIAPHLDADRLFTETKQGFDFYHEHFGMAYPFGKYDQIFCPEYNMGAMENAGAVTIRDEYVFTSKATHYRYERRADTILHELAHMWFGDLVTMRWWDDLWLNESFATWAAALSQAEATEYDTAWVTFANVEKSWAYQQDQLPSTHPILADATDIETVEQNFDGITYAKGASVLKQLQAYVGREEFLAGVRRHFADHAWGNATFDDLLAALQTASGRDLSGWADQWLKTTGINQLSPVFEVDGDGRYTTFTVEQSGAEPGAGELRTHRIAVGLYSLIDGRVTRTKRVELDVTGASTSVDALVGLEAADIVLVNDDDLTYCLMQLDEGSLRFVADNIDKIDDPMARTLCWSAAWEATRAGTMKARDFIRLVVLGAPTETELAVLERILAQATTALRTYADPAWAEEQGRDLLADALLAGVRESGPEASLVFEQALAKAPLNDVTADYLQKVLVESDDADMRWLALAALIAYGAIADVDKHIGEQRSKDRSATGEQAALRAAAAVNTVEVKRGVFDDVVAGELSNLAARHKLEGLRYPGSAAACAPLTDPYFEVAEDVWARLSTEMALQAINGLYPSWDISPEGLARADRFLARDLPSGLRRAVSEERSRVERALRNRGVDAA